MTHNPDRESVLYLRLPHGLKRDLQACATEAGLSTNAWAVNVLRLALREMRGFPAPPPALAPLPTPAESLRAYLAGEPLLTPCGQQGTCAGLDGDPEVLHGVRWCRECGIRLG